MPEHRLVVRILQSCLFTGAWLLAALGGAAEARHPRQVRVGLYQNPPKVFSDKSGRPAGIFVELIEEIARREGWDLRFVPGEWEDSLRALEAGQLDLMPDVAHTHERAQRFDFPTVAAAESWSQAYAHPVAKIEGLADLDGKRVAVLNSASQNLVFSRMMAGFGYEVELVEAESFDQAFAMVAERKADLVISNHFFGDYSHRRYGLHKTPIVFAPAELHFVTARGRRPELLRAITRHLGDWKADSASPYYKILGRWMDRPPAALLPPALLWALSALGGLLIVATLRILYLRRQVALKSGGLRQSEEQLAKEAVRRANLEAQLRAAQKMEAIGSLAGGVAHDFNNLLGVILGYTAVAQEKLRPDDPLREDLKEVALAAEKAAGLTRQLLAFSRQQPLQPVVLDINHAVSDMEKMLRRVLGASITLKAVLAPGLGRVRADPTQVEQVIVNLAVNARDAMPQGGQLTLETADVSLDEAYAQVHVGVTPGDYVMLAVSDSGHGMDAETQRRIFEPFFTTKEKGKGTGLGLATVYGIVQQSGGHLWVYSEPGRGSTFKVYLPKVEDALERPAPRLIAVPSGGGERVLLVEDEPALRSLFGKMLEGLGYQVQTAVDAEEALALVEERGLPCDLLMTDMVMPGLGGKALAERLRQTRPGLKVLFVSGYTDAGMGQVGDWDPGMQFLQKPFGRADLAAKVKGLLEG